MKNNYLKIKVLGVQLVLILFFISQSNAQCLQEGITFSSQLMIDNFSDNYPGCTHIIGDVTITESSGGNITNLDGLSSISLVEGMLSIENNTVLNNVDGLGNLQQVNGYFVVYNNTSMLNLSGLETLDSVGGFFIRDNSIMTDLSGLSGLLYIGDVCDVSNNPALLSLNGLNNLSEIANDLAINNNVLLENYQGLDMLEHIGGEFAVHNNDNLKSFSGLENLKTIGKTLEVFLCDSLINLDGLNNLGSVGRSLAIEENLGLTSLDGLESLESIGTTIYLVYNPLLENIEGLDNLTSIGESIQIINNPLLSSISSLLGVTGIGGALRISGNETLLSLTGIEHIDYTTITQLTITYNDMLSNCEVQSVCDFIGVPSNFPIIDGNAAGCENLEQVEEGCALVDISESLNKIAVRVYPNPGNGIIYIDGINNEYFEFSVWNSRGFLLINQQAIENDRMNLSYLSGGMYTLELRSGQQSVKKKIIIK